MSNTINIYTSKHKYLLRYDIGIGEEFQVETQGESLFFLKNLSKVDSNRIQLTPTSYNSLMELIDVVALEKEKKIYTREDLRKFLIFYEINIERFLLKEECTIDSILDEFFRKHISESNKS